jgi:aminoglycoside phosphotransferase (APT) family kinase protein
MISFPQDRTGIYYWKCDRAAAFHGTEAERPANPLLETQLRGALERRFPGVPLALRPADGQGNHRTFRLSIGPQEAFVRTEDGPERDNYFDVETAVIANLHRLGIPAPRVLACDCNRTDTPFAWQVLEYLPFPDLNQHYKQGTLALEPLAESIGEAVARWQEIRPQGFGPFSAKEAHATGQLVGLHPSYSSYLFLNLDRHLTFLTDRRFFTHRQAVAVLEAITRRQDLLGIAQGCLVHKDLALWNILGSPQRIAAFIDWDDAISGDPMDDLSLLGCFYGAPVIERALAGYARVRPLPENHLAHFWLCLLRNMLVKAVIRVGAGYFTRTDSFFLIGAGGSGSDLETFTRARIDTALRGLNENSDLSIL